MCVCVCMRPDALLWWSQRAGPPPRAAASALSPSHTSVQRLSIDLRRVCRPRPYRAEFETALLMEGFNLRQKERQRTLTLQLFSRCYKGTWQEEEKNHGRFSLLRFSHTSSGMVSHAWGCYIAADFCLDPFFKNKRQFLNLNTMFTAAFGVKSWYSNIISALKASQYVWDHASFWTLPLSDLCLTEWSSKTKMVFGSAG